MVPVEPAARPHTRRRGSRVAVVAQDAVLLLADSDPGIAGSRWWVTPGGGIDAGETPREAAVREIKEETGLDIDAADLRGPVAVREVVHGYSDRILTQQENFFVVVVAQRFDPSDEGFTEKERTTLSGWSWTRVADLADQDDPVWPAELADVIAAADSPERWPLDLGVVEESSVPVNLPK